MSDSVIYLNEMPTVSRIVYEQQSKIIVKNGIRKIYWQTECPFCHMLGWVTKANLLNRPKQATFCTEHRFLSWVKWVTPNESFLSSPNVEVDLTQQRLMPVGTKTPRGRKRKNRMVEILARCPDCKEERWVLVNGIRNAGFTTLCPSCAKIRTIPKGENNPNWNGGIQITNGYREVNVSILEKELTPEQLAVVNKYLFKRKKRRYEYEHRVVALLTYGPIAVRKGTVIRHLNGNKLDNRAENLIYGSQKDNCQDHSSAFRELKLWKYIALTLLRINAELTKNIEQEVSS